MRCEDVAHRALLALRVPSMAEIVTDRVTKSYPDGTAAAA